jgi:hypothetical protein
LIAGISIVAYLIGGLCVGLGGVLSGIIMWASALAIFAAAVVLIKIFGRNKKSSV